MALPETRWIGWAIVAVAVIVFVAQVRIENGGLRAQWPWLATRRTLLTGLAMVALIGLFAWYFWPTAIPNVVLLPASGQLNLINTGKEDIYVWGDKFDDQPKDVTENPRTIPVRGFYYFLTAKMAVSARSAVGVNGEKLVPFEVYLSTGNGVRYVAKFLLLVIMKDGEMSIHTQQLGVAGGPPYE